MKNVVELIKTLGVSEPNYYVQEINLNRFDLPSFAEYIASFSGYVWVFRTGSDYLVVRDNFANGMFVNNSNETRYSYKLYSLAKEIGQSSNELMTQILNELRHS